MSMKIAGEVADNAEAVVNKTREKHTPAEIDFTADQTLMSLLNQMQNLGTISQTHSSQIQSSAIETRQPQPKNKSSDTLHSNKGQLKYQSSDQSKQRSKEQLKDHATNMLQQTSMGQPDNVPAGRNKSSLLKIKGCKQYPIKMKSDQHT